MSELVSNEIKTLDPGMKVLDHGAKTSRHDQEGRLTGRGAEKKDVPEGVSFRKASPLQGKSLLFLGSSVTYGSAAGGVSMADHIRELDGCRVVKEAVSGTTLADRGPDSYVSRLKRVDGNQDFDAVVCQLSTNDASQGIPLGEIGSSRENFDTATVAGAIEAIIAYVQDTWHCPIVFYTGTRYDSPEYQAMVDLLPLLQEKWGIHILDLWNDEEMNRVGEEEYVRYMSDPIHPAHEGYLLWWTPKFQACLYELFSERA